MEVRPQSASESVVQPEWIYETAPVGLCLLDTELRYVRINARLAAMNGKPASAHIGRRLQEVVPELGLTLEPTLHQILRTGEPILDLEIHGTTPSEAEGFWLCNFHPVKSADGRVQGITCAVHDITALKRAEEEARVLKEYLDTILLNLPVGVAILEGPDFRYFRINKWLAELNGQSVEDHLGKTVAEALPDSAHILANLRKVRDDGKAILSHEFTVTLPGHPDKQHHLLDFHFPITVGGEMKAVGAVVLDITARRQAEEALREAHDQLEQQVRDRTMELVQANEALKAENAERRQAQQELEKSEQRLRQLLETTRAVPWTAETKTFQFTYVGPKAVELLGYPTDQWCEHDFWPDRLHPDDRDAAVDYCLTNWQRMTAFEFEYRMIAADGRIVWIHDMVNVRRRAGEPAVLYGFMIDITERKRADEERRLLQEEIAHFSRVATMGELAASVAHEVNQPLTAIVSNARAGQRLLARESVDHDELRAILADVAADGLRGGEVIRRVRNLVKKGESQRRTLDVNELVLEVLPLVKNEAIRRNVSLEHQVAPGLPPVTGDRVQLQQVVLNLIVNGFDALGPVAADRRTLTLETSIGEAGTVQIAVRDSGVGLDPEHTDRIFEPFFTTKPQGMGMGLTINRSIVEAHGGRLWATPNADQGTTFAFTLPAGGN